MFDSLTERLQGVMQSLKGHGRLTAGIDESVASQKLFVTGNYFAGMAVEDCIVRSRKEFERLSGTL